GGCPRPAAAREVELDLKSLAPELAALRLPELEPFAAGSPEARRNKSEREKALAAPRGPHRAEAGGGGAPGAGAVRGGQPGGAPQQERGGEGARGAARPARGEGGGRVARRA